MQRTILVVGNFGAESFALHIAEALQDMGHLALRFDPTVPYVRARSRPLRVLQKGRRIIAGLAGEIAYFRARTFRKLCGLLSSRPVELTLVTHDFLWPHEVAEIRARTGRPVVLWFPDSIASFGRAYFLAAPYDALFFKDPYIVHRLKRDLSAPTFYLPECMSPRRHTDTRPLTAADRRLYGCDICTAGNMHAYRLAFFRQLEEFDVKLWGNPPSAGLRSHPVTVNFFKDRFVADREKSAAFRSAKIVVNNLLPSEIWGVNARTFEIAGAGGFQLVDRRPALSQLFAEDREIVSFDGDVDLKAKIATYLHDDERRDRIAQAAQLRALSDHTYENRLSTLINTVLGAERGYVMPPTPAGW